jgi:hypothetical protein
LRAPARYGVRATVPSERLHSLCNTIP